MAYIRLNLDKAPSRVWLYFYYAGQKIPPNKKTSSGFAARFSESAYAPALDLLRNEAPVYINYDETIKSAFLSTSFEAVGEGEGLLPAPD